MADPTIEKEDTSNPVVDYISSKYYNGGSKAELSQKFNSDQGALEKAIAETHVHYGKQGQTLGEFETDYYKQYGNPFEKKKPTSQNSGPLPPNPEETPEIPSLEESQKSYKPQEQESGDGSANQSDDWEGTITHVGDSEAQRARIKAVQKNENAKEKEGLSRVESAMNTFSKAFGSFPADVLEVSTILGNKLEQIAPIGDQPSVEDSKLTDFAKKYRGYLDEQLPTNSKYQGEILADVVPNAAGTLATMLVTGGESGAVKAIAPLTTASRAMAIGTKVAGLSSKAAQFATSPTAVTAAIQIGASEYNQAIEGGATPEQATSVALKNMAVGSMLEAIPIVHFFNRLNKTTGGGFTKTLQKMATTGATQGTEEAVTEVAQQFYSNYTASQTYDATRQWYDGMKESGGVGFGIGFVLGAMGTSLRRRQQSSTSEQEKAEIQKSIDFVDHKTQDLEDGTLTDQGKEIGPKDPVNTIQEATTEVNNTEQQLTTEVQTSAADSGQIPENQSNVGDANGETINNDTNPIEENDSQNQQRIPGEVGIGTEEPVSNESEQTAGGEENSAGGNVQEEGANTKEQQPKIEKNKEGVYYGEAYHGKSDGKEKGESVYLGSESLADSYSDNGKVGKYHYKLEHPFIVSKDSDFDSIQKHIDNYTKDHPEAKWHPDITNYINSKLKEEGYNGLIINESALESEKGYQEIGGTYGDPQVVVFDRKNISKEPFSQDSPLEQTIISHVKEGDDIDYFESDFERPQDFQIVKDYIHDKIKQETTGDRVGPEGQKLEETKTNGTEGSGVISSIRDKNERFGLSEGAEKRRLAEEIIEDVDTFVEDQKLSTEGVEKKDRLFAKQVLKNPDLSDEIKKGLSEEGRKYIPITNKLTIKEASALIEEKGIKQAHKDYITKNNGLHPAVRTMMGELLIKKYNQLASKSTTAEERNKNIDRAINVADDLAIHLTSLGQAIQAASVFAKLSPEGIIRAIKKEITKSKKVKLDRLQPDITATQTEIDKINTESIEEVLKGKIKDVITDKSKKSTAQKRKKAVKEAVDFLEKLKINTKGNTLNSAAPIAIPVAAYNAAITTIQGSLKAGDMVLTAIEKAVKYINTQVKKGSWGEEAFRKDLEDKLSAFDQVIDPKKVVTNAIKDHEVNLKELVKKHYTELDKAKQSLTEKLISESGLNEQEAGELAVEIGKEFDKIATKKKREFLNKKISSLEKALQPKVAKQKQQLYDKIIELTNARTLTHKEFEDLYSQYFELPKLSTDQIGKITELANKVQNAKGPEAQSKATQDLLKYQSSLSGINMADVAMSIWYANVLSGLSTQTMNVYANFTETAGELWTSVIDDPKKAKRMAMGLFQGYGKGLLQAKDVLKTGYTPVRDSKIDNQNVLERYTLPGGHWNPYNYLKYIGRVMAASDIFAYAGLKEMRSQQLAMAIALKEGKEAPTSLIEKRANEILYNTKERSAEAEITAVKEGLTGDAKQRRVFELMEEGRPETLTEDAKDFAAQGTFNYDPVGIMGALTYGINQVSNVVIIKGIKPISFIVPFTRIIANVTNRYLDWSPWGLVRAAKGGVGYKNPLLGDRFVKEYTPEERRREVIKAVTGTMGMIAMYALTEPDEEGNSEIEITADGTGDYKKNYELAETGWQPYSVKIDGKWYEYKNTPLAIPFAWIGYHRDTQKYKDEKSDGDKLGIMMYGSVKYVMDMSFLSSLSDFFTAFSKDHSEGAGFLEKAGKATARTAKSFVIPNLFTQLARSYEELNDLPLKQAKSIQEDLVRDMPVLRDNLNDMYNALGEPVYPDQNKKYIPFKVNPESDDKVWKLIIDNQAWIGTPKKNQIVYDRKLKGERSMTEDEYNAFAILSGQKIKKKIEENYKALIKMDKGAVQDKIKDYKEVARKSSKYEVIRNSK